MNNLSIIYCFKIGLCSILIYIGEHKTEIQHDELKQIIEKFQQENNYFIERKSQSYLFAVDYIHNLSISIK